MREPAPIEWCPFPRQRPMPYNARVFLLRYRRDGQVRMVILNGFPSPTHGWLLHGLSRGPSSTAVR
jgi:hypothetical protein